MVVVLVLLVVILVIVLKVVVALEAFVLRVDQIKRRMSVLQIASLLWINVKSSNR